MEGAVVEHAFDDPSEDIPDRRTAEGTPEDGSDNDTPSDAGTWWVVARPEAVGADRADRARRGTGSWGSLGVRA